MQSDIKLKPGKVQIDAWDLLMDTKSRRKKSSGERRALVHDFNDGLTINFNADYPGGLTLKGVMVLEGNAKHKHPGGTSINARIVEINGTDIILDSKSRRRRGVSPKFRRALVHDFGDKLTLNYAKDYPGGIKLNGNIQMPGNVVISSSLKVGSGAAQLDLLKEIKKLKKEISLLQNRVKQLEKK